MLLQKVCPEAKKSSVLVFSSYSNPPACQDILADVYNSFQTRFSSEPDLFKHTFLSSLTILLMLIA